MSTNPPPTTTTTTTLAAAPYVSYAPLAGSFVSVPGYLPASTGPIIYPAQARSITPTVMYAPRGITPVASSPYRPGIPIVANTQPAYISRPPSAPGLASNRSINFQTIQANRAAAAAATSTASSTSPEKVSNRSINFQTIQANRAAAATSTASTTSPEAPKNRSLNHQTIDAERAAVTEATATTTPTATTTASPEKPMNRSLNHQTIDANRSQAIQRTPSGRAVTPTGVFTHGPVSRSYFVPGTHPHAQAQAHAHPIPHPHPSQTQPFAQPRSTAAAPVMRQGMKTQPDAARVQKAEQEAHDARSEAKRTAELLHQAEEARRRAEAEAADAKKQLHDLQQQLLLARSGSTRSLPYESLGLTAHDQDTHASTHSSAYTGFPVAAVAHHAPLAAGYVHPEQLSQTALTSSGDNPVGNPRFFDPAQPSSPSASASQAANLNAAAAPNPSSSFHYAADAGSNAATGVLSSANINPLTGKPRA